MSSANVQTRVDCLNCGGVRYVRYEVPPGDPRFGRTYPCPVCNPEDVTYRSGLLPHERSIRLDFLEVGAGREGALAMVEAGRRFVSKGFTGIISVHGGWGNGKTTFLKALTNEAIEAGQDARYIRMVELMAIVKEAFSSTEGGDTDFSRIHRFASQPILFIDEVDKARGTGYVREVQSFLFDERYRRAGQLGTVFAWNGGFSDLEMPWLTSRLSEFDVIENQDHDMRPHLKE